MILGLLTLVVASLSSCGKPVPSPEAVAIESLDGLDIDTPREIRDLSIVSFGDDSLCAAWTLPGRDNSGLRITADSIVLATSASGAAWNRRASFAVKPPESARLFRGARNLYALLSHSRRLLLIRPDLTVDTLNDLDFPGTHTGIGMDISIQEPHTVWAAYNLIAADENREPREYIALARWRLGGQLEALSIVASFPRPTLENIPVQLSVQGDHFRILVSPADSSGTPGIGGRLVGRSVLLLDRMADGPWTSVWCNPEASTESWHPLIAMGLRFDAGGGGEFGIVELRGAPIYALDLKSVPDSLKTILLDRNMVLGSSDPIFPRLGIVKSSGSECGLAAWIGSQSPDRPVPGRPRRTNPFLELLNKAAPFDLFVASVTSPAMPGGHAQSVSDFALWGPDESAVDLAMAPVRGGAVILVTTRDMTTAATWDSHLHAVRVRCKPLKRGDDRVE